MEKKTNYMKMVELWFSGELELYRTTGDARAFTKAVKDKIPESFRNGQRSRRSTKENESKSED